MDHCSKIEDYEVISKLGSGSFGEVQLVSRGGKRYALKKISKKHILKVNKLHEPFIEKETLYRLQEVSKVKELFVNIFDTHSDPNYMYMILEFCDGGTLEQLIQSNDVSSETLRKIIVKIVIILEELSRFGIVHRDLKPSNLLFTSSGFLKLADFGTAQVPSGMFTKEVADKIKQIKQTRYAGQENKDEEEEESKRRSTFVGTACYMAPELLTEDVCQKQADLWALGCIIYELHYKRSPFFETNEGTVWKKITDGEVDYSMPSKFHSVAHLDELIKSFLIKDKNQRLGVSGVGFQNIKGHPYFAGIDWASQVETGIPEVIGLIKEANHTTNNPADKVLLSGVVGKKMYFGNFKDRMMILYALPKLVYYCTDSGDKKGEILLSHSTKLSIEGKLFTITTQKKPYVFKCKNLHEWLETIRYAIENACY